MNFAETMTANPPRLVVLFHRAHDGNEQYQWGVVGSIPVLSLIGAIVGIQSDMVASEWIPECDHNPPALVIAWDAEEKEFSRFKHPGIPHTSLVGMLETIKAMLVNSRLGQHNAAQKVEILGVDGRPMRA